MKLFTHTLFSFFLVTQICFGQWYGQTSETNSCLNSVHFEDASNGWAVGDSGKIIHTDNGGLTWLQQTSGTTNHLTDVYFIDMNIGFAVGANGTILKTDNGGIIWSQLSTGTNNSLNGVCFIDTVTGWIVGGYRYWPNDISIILHTSDGGINWTQQTFEDTTGLNDVYFTDMNNGWAVGWKNYPNYKGIILRTTNGGINWMPQNSGTEWPLNGVDFIDENTGWVVGGKIGPLPLAKSSQLAEDGPGIVLKTTDGGMTWTTQMDTLSEGLFGVSFVDDNFGCAVGFSNCMASGCLWGVVVYTNDGGVNWTSQFKENSSWFRDVYFIDANIGWVVGGNYYLDSLYVYSGRILHTTNGGVAFVEEEQISEIPATYFLSNNYPNPFNPSTRIRYSVPHTSRVVINIYDILGNELETLINEEKPVGTYEVTWNAANLPSGVSAKGGYASGVYFYRIQAGSFLETKKMILMK
jgi:photosystem II stability/assembly factor-like uncharacterized protein